MPLWFCAAHDRGIRCRYRLILGNAMTMKRMMVPLFALAAMLQTTTATAQGGMPKPLSAEALVDAIDPLKAAWLTANIVGEGPITGPLRFGFPERFYRSKLILLGESHGFAAPQVLDYQLLVHLNRRIGLTQYLAEIDPVQAVYLNRFLVDGDRAALDAVFSHWNSAGVQWGNRAFRAKVEAIRAYNLGVPVKRRIVFVGIDTIQDWALLAHWLGGDALVALGDAALPRSERARRMLAVKTAHMGPELALVGATLADVVAKKDRESIIFANYARVVREGPLRGKPAYGLWGFYHVLNGGVSASMPFAARVAASDLPSARKLTTIGALALDSALQIPIPSGEAKFMRLRLTEFNIDGPYVKVQGSATLRSVSLAKAVKLFATGGTDSPITATDFVDVTTSVGQNLKVDDTSLGAKQLLDYVAVFRNSDWAAPLDD